MQSFSVRVKSSATTRSKSSPPEMLENGCKPPDQEARIAQLTTPSPWWFLWGFQKLRPAAGVFGASGGSWCWFLLAPEIFDKTHVVLGQEHSWYLVLVFRGSASYKLGGQFLVGGFVHHFMDNSKSSFAQLLLYLVAGFEFHSWLSHDEAVLKGGGFVCKEHHFNYRSTSNVASLNPRSY